MDQLEVAPEEIGEALVVVVAFAAAVEALSLLGLEELCILKNYRSKVLTFLIFKIVIIFASGKYKRELWIPLFFVNDMIH